MSMKTWPSRNMWQAATAATLILGGVEAARAAEGVFSLGEIEVVDRAEKDKNVSTDRVLEEDMREQGKNSVNEVVALVPGVMLGTTGPRNEGTTFVRGFVRGSRRRRTRTSAASTSGAPRWRAT